MTANERKAYIAGLIDGEGYVGMVKTITRPTVAPNTYVLVPRIQVKMCDRDGIDLAHEIFGGSIYCRKANGNNRATWTWQVTNKKNVKSCLKLLAPYLMIKKHQADCVLKFLERERGTRYTEVEWNIYGTIRELNRTGRY